jgi:hypothetical protein
MGCTGLGCEATVFGRMSNKSRYSIDILEVALDLMECLAEEGSRPQKASRLARQMGVSYNRIFRILKTLEARGYVQGSDEWEGYLLGPGFIKLSERAREHVTSGSRQDSSDSGFRSDEKRHLFWQPRPLHVTEPRRLTRIGLPEQSEDERQRYETEATNLVEAAREQAITLRVLGGVAFGLQCPHYAVLHRILGRSYSDINLAAHRDQASRVASFFATLGYGEDAEINLTYASEHMIFYHPIVPGLHVDVFFDKLGFCHEVSWVGRLELDPLTLPLAELLMEKLQIVKINEKDVVDTIVLFLEHRVGDHDEQTINVARIARLCANDWGMWRTFIMNLDKIRRMARSYDELDSEAQERVTAQVASIKASIDREPKSLAWRLRARVGDRVKWYQEVDEVG